MQGRWTGHHVHSKECDGTSRGYKANLPWQLMLHLGSVPKALQPSGAADPSCPFKRTSPSPSAPTIEWVMCRRRNGDSELHQAAATRVAQFCCETGDRYWHSQTSWIAGWQQKEHFRELRNAASVRAGERADHCSTEKASSVPGCQEVPRTRILLLGVCRELSGEKTAGSTLGNQCVGRNIGTITALCQAGLGRSWESDYIWISAVKISA